MDLQKWQGLPYYPINLFYKQTFGEKVYKIPVSVPGTCPNREGLKGMKTCIFCDEWGSAAYPENSKLHLDEQIVTNRGYITKRTKAKKFLVYFQAYTYTYQRVANLRSYFEAAMDHEDVVGLVIGTRPDCVSEALYDLLNEYSQKTQIFVEFGVQSFNNEQLQWMERGHTGEKSIWAIKKMHEKCPKVNIGIHLMFGLPGETEKQIIESAKLCNTLPLHNVKLHNTHVLKNTELERQYKQGEYEPIELEPYSYLVMRFLQHLNPEIPVHRLTASSSRSDELIAPKWTGDKMYSYQYVIDYLNMNKAYQGQNL